MQKVLATALLVAGSQAQLTIADGFTFEATYDSVNNNIVFKTTQPNLSWMGILLGSQHMDGTDAIGWKAMNA